MKKWVLLAAMAVFVWGCGSGTAQTPKEGDAKAKEQKDQPETAAKKEATVVKMHKSGTWDPGLTDEEKETLFAIVQDTLKWCVGGSRGAFSFEKYKMTKKLEEPTHSFVTLRRKDGDLRGCIGSLPPMDAAPMYRSVHGNAVHAAMSDPRFPRVTPDELPTLKVDISLLSPVSAIKSVDEFKIGEHGIIVSQGGRRGVFLPEVAVEQGWTKEETLAHVCSGKAGLPADAWRKGAAMSVFSSVVLSR